MKKLIITLVSLALVYLLFTIVAPPMVEKSQNQTQQLPPYNTSAIARQVYNSLDFVADLHSDSLLWDRNLINESNYGHVDFPRQRKARVAMQAYTIVTKSPKGLNMQKNSADARDDITLLSIGQGQPPRTWFSLFERARYQAKKLHKLANKDDNFKIIKSAEDLKAFLIEKKSNPNLISGLLGIEGAHSLEGNLENVQKHYDAGVRMMAATHFFDNELGGSAHGISHAGLTEFGEQVIDKMNELGMIIDLAHISPKMLDDILARTSKPVLVSHTGVKGVLDSPRNLSDAHIQAIADNKGIIGIAFFAEAAGEKGIRSIVASMKHVRDLVGIEHVALGSDFDGSVTVPFDITGMPLLVEEMLNQEFTRDEIGAVMGENVKRFMLENL